MVCIFEQHTKKKFVHSEINQEVNNSIIFPPFLIDKKSGVTVVKTQFEQKMFDVCANPPPDFDRGIKLTKNKNPDEKNEKCKVTKMNPPTISEM